MSKQIKFFKLKVLPTLIEPDCIYIIKGDIDAVAQIYASSGIGQLIPIANIGVIQELIDQALATFDLDIQFGWNEDLIGIKNGSNPIFTTPHPFKPGNITVNVNGLEVKETMDYVIDVQQVVFFVSPLTTDSITATYIKQ